MQGTALITQIAQATGLPQHLISNELEQLISQRGKSAGDISLEEIRGILAEYLQEVLLKAKEELSSSGL